LDYVQFHGVGESTARLCFDRALCAIDSAIPMAFDVEDEDMLRALATRFSEKSDGVLDTIVGAVDGVHVKVRKGGEVGAMYYCRKGFHSVNAQAIVGPDRQDRQVLSLSLACVGASHDSVCWGASKVGQDIAAGKMPAWATIVGDDAYSAASRLSVSRQDPYRGRGQLQLLDLEQPHRGECV
jgi:hypothetical protein